MTRSTIAAIKEALTSSLRGAAPGVVIAFDYAASVDADRAIVIDGVTINYTHQLDLGSYRSIAAELHLYTKTAAALDSLIDGVDALDGADTTVLRYITIGRIAIDGDDPDVKEAQISITADIDEVASHEPG